MAESIDIRELNIRIEQQSQFVTNLVMGMNKVIVGQKHLVDCLLIGLLSDGHILLEGVPGLAKTLAIKTLSQLISADFSRIQFTPDLMPSDVLGTTVFNMKTNDFDFHQGPVFADIVLVDFTAPHLMPCHNVMNGLVFSAKGGDVAMTMVRGQILYQNGKFPTIDLNNVVEDLVSEAIPKLFQKDEPMTEAK